MTAQQGSAGGRGPGGRPSSGSQGGSAAGRTPSGTGPSTGGMSPGVAPAQQGAGGEVRSGLSPTYTEKMSGQGSSQGDAPFGTGDSGTAGGPTASKRGCGCCGGAILAMVGVALILSVLLIL
jgi:hypothetical protein